MTQTLAKTNGTQALETRQAWTQQQLSLIRDKAAKNTTPQEFEQFLYTCAAYDLNPLLGEIYVQKYKKGGSNGDFYPATIIITFAGLLKVANRQDTIDGMEADAELDEKGFPIYAWARVWKRGATHPFTSKVWFKEYNSGENLWKTKPITMLQKVAKAHALRQALNLSGVVVQEEMDRAEMEYSAPVPSTRGGKIIEGEVTEARPEQKAAPAPVKPAAPARTRDQVNKALAKHEDTATLIIGNGYEPLAFAEFQNEWLPRTFPEASGYQEAAVALAAALGFEKFGLALANAKGRCATDMYRLLMHDYVWAEMELNPNADLSWDAENGQPIPVSLAVNANKEAGANLDKREKAATELFGEEDTSDIDIPL